MTRQSYPPLRPQPPVRPRRQRPLPWPLISGVVVLAVLLGIAAVVLFGPDGGGGTGTPGSASPGATVPATSGAPASVAPTAPPPSAASPSATAGFPPNSVVTLIAEALTLRAAPGTEGEVLARLPAQQLAYVVVGPQEADGLPWYYLSGMGLPFATGCGPHEPGDLLECPAWLGWVAAADDDGTPWIEAAQPPACPPPESPSTVASLSELPYTMRLICYSGQELTLRAWWPADSEPLAPDAACPASGAAVGWLVCQNLNQQYLAVSDGDPGGRLAVSIDPLGGLAMPDRGQWVDVTGRFDDPAAQSCGDVAGLMATDPLELIFSCRLQFVVTAAAPAPPP